MADSDDVLADLRVGDGYVPDYNRGEADRRQAYKPGQAIEYLHPDGNEWRPGTFLGWEKPGLARVAPVSGEPGVVRAGSRLRPAPAHYQFADLDWQPRWNKADAPHAALSQSGPDVMATGFFGVVRVQLDDAASVAAIIQQARVFADMLHAAKVRYDAGLGVQHQDPYDPPRTLFDTSSRQALLDARRDLNRRIADASARHD